jgi:hypothetical protein
VALSKGGKNAMGQFPLYGVNFCPLAPMPHSFKGKFLKVTGYPNMKLYSTTAN